MAKKAVEETLAVTALKKLLEVKHLVKERILLGYNDRHEFFLYLTNNCLVEKTPGGEHNLVGKTAQLINVRVYSLNHKELEQLYKKLHEQKSS